MNGIVLKVNTEVLKSQAKIITSKINAIQKQLSIIDDSVNRISKYWEGNASVHHIKNYKEIKELATNTVLMLKENPIDLLKMAECYDETEIKSLEIENSLPEDVVI